MRHLAADLTPCVDPGLAVGPSPASVGHRGSGPGVGGSPQTAASARLGSAPESDFRSWGELLVLCLGHLSFYEGDLYVTSGLREFLYWVGLWATTPHSMFPGEGRGPITFTAKASQPQEGACRAAGTGLPSAGPVRGLATGSGEPQGRGRRQTPSFPADSKGTLCPGRTPVPDRNRTASEVQLAARQPGNRQAAARAPGGVARPGQGRAVKDGSASLPSGSRSRRWSRTLVPSPGLCPGTPLPLRDKRAPQGDPRPGSTGVPAEALGRP